MGHNLEGYDVSLEDSLQLAKVFETLANRIHYSEISQLFLFESRYYLLVAKCKERGITEDYPFVRQTDSISPRRKPIAGRSFLPFIQAPLTHWKKRSKATKTFK